MIEVAHLTKRYPGRLAVDDLSFQVGRGDVVGFLGPNGAGKTTTMRILTGFIPATGGKVLIGGVDISRDSVRVRRNIGYLPESCPLYDEMRVREYLKYRANLKGLRGAARRSRIDHVLDLCGLKDVRGRIIGHLSKGYRQRVGLADALVHDPDLLILDEPTIGLDPNQIREMRGLIKDLASEHTVLLSTHILSEVEATCERVLILNEGRMVASDTPRRLSEVLGGGTRVVAQVRGPHAEILEACEKLTGVQKVKVVTNGSWLDVELRGNGHVDLCETVFKLAVQRGWTLRELRTVETNLEDIFGALTDGSGNGGGSA